MESDYRHSREQNACTILSCLTKGTKGVRLESTTISGLAVRRNVGLGSPTNSQPGRLRYVAHASGLRVLAASSRQFWWYLQDAPGKAGHTYCGDRWISYKCRRADCGLECGGK